MFKNNNVNLKKEFERMGSTVEHDGLVASYLVFWLGSKRERSTEEICK